tara:strand:+ start:319 stop:786 length:468 start_codon:yes stop_codon:yes gene_type:complete
LNTKFNSQKAPRAFRTISEVAGELDLQPYVIRFWESQFKQIKPMRRKGGRRYYRPRDIDFLRGLKVLLHEENLTIKKVKEIIIKKGKEFIVAQQNEKIDDYSPVEKRKIQIKFSHTGKKTIYMKAIANEEKKLQINYLIESLNKLRKQMLARKNF